MGKKLNAGDAFPKLVLRLPEGQTLSVPDELGANYTVLLFFRGHW